MKKAILCIVVYLCSVSAFGQSPELEKELLNKAWKNGEITADDAKERVKMLKEIESDYPILPYDTISGVLNITRIISFPGVTQLQAFKRMREWAALNFGSIDAALNYEDDESGKLIFKGWTPVWYSATFKNIFGNIKTAAFPEKRELHFSMVVTVKNARAKVEFKNLRYKHIIAGGISPITNQYVPTYEYEYPVTAAFPLAMTPVGTWKGTIDLIKNTMTALNTFAPSMEKHIRDLISDYDF